MSSEASPSPSKIHSKLEPSPEERNEMIRVEAYYIAERDGFKCNEAEYWVLAEQHISKMIPSRGCQVEPRIADSNDGKATAKKTISTKKKINPDHRKSPRVPVQKTIPASNLHLSDLAEVVDISLGGISAAFIKSIETGKRLIVSLSSGTGNFDKTNEIELEVLRCQEISNNPPFKYHVGAKFINASEEQIRSIAKSINANENYTHVDATFVNRAAIILIREAI